MHHKDVMPDDGSTRFLGKLNVRLVDLVEKNLAFLDRKGVAERAKFEVAVDAGDVSAAKAAPTRDCRRVERGGSGEIDGK